MSATSTGPALLPWTEDDQANRLLAEDPNALLIGFALDQQVTVQKAFAGPLVLKQRLGHLDPARIAAMPPDDLVAVFRDRPAIHRFPGAMAERIGALPGFGDMKVRSLAATLIKQFGVKPDGWEQVLPSHPTLGDADTPEALAAYQAAKREHKRQVRAQRERKE